MSPRVVLHRLREWPEFGALRPLLDAAGVDHVAYEYWHFYATEARVTEALVAAMPERNERPLDCAPLLLAGAALAHLGRSVADPSAEPLHVGYHDAAPLEVLTAAAQACGVEVRRRSAGGSSAPRRASTGPGRPEVAHEPATFQDLCQRGRLERRDSSTWALAMAPYFARLDEVARWHEIADLFLAQQDFPPPLSALACLVAERWCRATGFGALDLDGLTACDYLSADAAFHRDVVLLHRSRVLGGADRPLAALIAVAYRRSREAMTDADDRRLRELAVAAADRADTTLCALDEARTLALLDEQAFAEVVVRVFGRAVEAGFVGATGHGDAEGFARTVADVARRDPDLCLRGWAALTETFNEHGLLAHLAAWEQLLPRSGYSARVREEVGRWFGRPSARAAGLILRTLLEARGVHVVHEALPALADVDVTVEIGTDVGHVVLGSPSAVRAIEALPDPADWPAALRKLMCVGLRTGGDGSFIVGHAPGAHVAAGSTPCARFPLRVSDDAVTVSGIVGAGGTPTIGFPSGRYDAEVRRTAAGHILVVVTVPAKPTRWTHGRVLPAWG